MAGIEGRKTMIKHFGKIFLVKLKVYVISVSVFLTTKPLGRMTRASKAFLC